MDNRSQPKISASISISPTTSSFANPQALSLNLTILSDHSYPITIYADDSSPALMLKCGAFIITDLSTGSEVKQSISTHCRIPPPTKVAVPVSENILHTLLPNTPLTLSAPFTWKHTSTGNKTSATDSTNNTNDRKSKLGAYVVDGLEPGQGYALSLASKPRIHWTSIRWWEYGTKEEVLRSGLDGRKVRYSPGPHEAIAVDTTGIGAVAFRFQE